MGCTQSTQQATYATLDADPLAEKQSARIDHDLQQAKALCKSTTNMLLLGAGESGKSTVVKQFRLINQGTYSDEERYEYREILVSNVVTSMQAILEALPNLRIRFEDDLIAHATIVLSAASGPFFQESFNQVLSRSIWILQKSRPVREALSRRAEFQLNDSAEYFFQAIPRLVTPGYLPTDEDMLHARVKTTGVLEHEIKIRNRLFKITDVGGQRSERKKWLLVFSDIDVLLFIAAISEYDQKLREDHTVSRLQETLDLFEKVVNSSWFAKSTIILFLNKMDLFASKLHSISIEDHLTDFPAGRGLETEFAARFMQDKFISLYSRSDKSIYSHFTTATDTRAMTFVLKSCTDSILKNSLISTGIL